MAKTFIASKSWLRRLAGTLVAIKKKENKYMKNFKSNIDDLQKWIVFIKKSIGVVHFIEILIVALLGIASSNFIDKAVTAEGVVNSNINSNWCYILILSIVLYAAIKVFYLFHHKLFPDKATKSITESYELTKYREQNTRKDIINDSFTRTLVVLNNTTCEYLNEELSNELIQKSIEDSLRSVLKDFISNLNTILEIDNSKYTVGAFIKGLLVMPNAANPIKQGEAIPSIDGVFIIEDSLNVEEICIPKALMTTSQHPDCVVDIKSNIQKSLNKKGFHSGTFKEGKCNYTINCNFIPVYCNEEEEAGCLFIVSEALEEIPYDLKSILDVYCRIISNWIVSRENCVYNKINYQVQNYGCCPPE